MSNATKYKRSHRQQWLDKYGVSAKVGTIPGIIRIDKRCTIAVGKCVRFQELENGNWILGVVTNVDPLRITRK